MSHTPAHRRGFAQQSNRQPARGDGEASGRRDVSGRLSGKKAWPDPAAALTGQAWRRPLEERTSARNGVKPELVYDSPKVVFSAPIPAPKPLPPTSLRIVSGRIKRSKEQQANHDAQRLPVRLA